jgi:hypothetical protein
MALKVLQLALQFLNRIVYNFAVVALSAPPNSQLVVHLPGFSSKGIGRGAARCTEGVGQVERVRYK